MFSGFKERPKVDFNKFLTPRNFNIFIHIAKKAGADVSKNYTGNLTLAAQNNFKNQGKNYQKAYKNFKKVIKAGAVTLKKYAYFTITDFE